MPPVWDPQERTGGPFRRVLGSLFPRSVLFVTADLFRGKWYNTEGRQRHLPFPLAMIADDNCLWTKCGRKCRWGNGDHTLISRIWALQAPNEGFEGVPYALRTGIARDRVGWINNRGPVPALL